MIHRREVCFITMNMNNEQKNTYVKKQITAALLELLKENPFSDISVSELTNLLRIVIQTGTDDTEAIRCQYPAMQLISLVLLVLFIFLI